MKKLLILFSLLVAFTTQANSQIRDIDIEVKLLDPKTNDTVYLWKPFDVEIQIKNLGPDTLTVNDSAYLKFIMNSQPQFNIPTPYAATYLIPGDSASLKIKLVLSQGVMAGKHTICTDISVQNKIDTIIDRDTTNNISCASIYVQDTTLSVTHTVIQKESVNVYPNPANNISYFEVTLDNTTDVHITITDMTGRVVIKNQHKKLQKGTHKLEVQTDKLPTGNYLYRVYTNGIINTGKLQIE